MIFALMFGLGNVPLSIVSGTLPLALFGSEGCGKLQGKVMAARLIVSASAPFVTVLAMEGLGFSLSLAGIVGLGLLALPCSSCLGAFAAKAW
ncbi:hypothetical protein [Agrobacterium larrymoorei]|uniref:MFS transporter n=1 Tax=Agrobacterium larrymoorei TaxID=160699 RepID=A0A4D7DZY2_9HYPH|nr:hypothetical protein [Agrobacterium larrymoorei]QCJ00878.1 hypothetical protein CFBP5473_23030 [Agrobacterium larrymoorei]QYA10214.1 hypothetical protein J5285_23700 [Agrobacterium larrymoorei]